MARKVILDCDPGIDDAVALTMALFDPRLEVVAVTATGGNVDGARATRNVQAIVEQLDPARWPRIGAADPDVLLTAHRREIHGPTGLGDAEFPVAELHHRHASDKVICDEIQAASGEVTIVCLGPLTNVAAAAQRDPSLYSRIGHLVVVGGTYSAAGSVTAAAEFNIFANPTAAQLIFRLPITMTVVPLDVTSQVLMTFDQFDELPGENTRKGALLRRILPYSFRSHRQSLGLEGIFLRDAVGLVAVLHPELFQTQRVHGDVETRGELTRGATVFDRRPRPTHQPNMEVATGVDAPAVMDCIMRCLKARE